MAVSAIGGEPGPHDALELRIEGERLHELRALAYLLTIKRARSPGELRSEVSLTEAVTLAVAHELAYQQAQIV
jgi:hypothetical protein